MSDLSKLKAFQWDQINKGSIDGQLLAQAVCILGWAKFPDKRPDEILDFIKDTILHPFVNEPAEETFKRLALKRQSKNN